MADPYYAYTAPTTDRATATRASFPGYLSSETPSLASRHAFGYGDQRTFSSDALQKDVNPVGPGTYGVDDILGRGIRPEPGTRRLAAGARLRGYSSPLEDPVLHQRQDFSAGISPIISATERSSSLRNFDSLAEPARESNILFVQGLPTDCTRREVGRILFVHCMLYQNTLTIFHCLNRSLEFKDGALGIILVLQAIVQLHVLSRI
ncbi:hypothetical protein EUGRSUZ_C00672 [Eucalyptus grandis]|uniref:Uncharacterized protein n=2 Tax=Eucalyptus grandis TaxID=71139 RepID=A0ACC3LAI6_EUCGR|nr:hypothetical protein EUGRSUZ_C00672 [Eucalyptus grandis]